MELFSRNLADISIGHISQYTTGASVPHGSVLEPIMQNISNDLLQRFPPSNSYANDYTLLYTCKYLRRYCEYV